MDARSMLTATRTAARTRTRAMDLEAAGTTTAAASTTTTITGDITRIMATETADMVVVVAPDGTIAHRETMTGTEVVVHRDKETMAMEMEDHNQDPTRGAAGVPLQAQDMDPAVTLTDHPLHPVGIGLRDQVESAAVAGIRDGIRNHSRAVADTVVVAMEVRTETRATEIDRTPDTHPAQALMETDPDPQRVADHLPVRVAVEWVPDPRQDRAIPTNESATTRLTEN